MHAIQFRCHLAETTGPLPHFWEHTVGSGHAPLACGRTGKPVAALP